MNQVCSQCNKKQSTETMIQMGEVLICAYCKPSYIQALKEGTPPPQRYHGSRIILGFLSGLQFTALTLAYLQCDQDDLAEASQWVIFSIYLVVGAITVITTVNPKKVVLKVLIATLSLQLAWGLWVIFRQGEVWLSFAKMMSTTLEVTVMIVVYMLFLIMVPLITLIISSRFLKRLNCNGEQGSPIPSGSD